MRSKEQKITNATKHASALIFKVFILLIKAITERLFILRDPVVTLSTLQGWRYPVFLINSFASASTIGVHWRDVFSAYQMLPLKIFLFRVRISSLLPPSGRGVLIYDGDFGRQIACSKSISMDKRYYLTPRAPGLYVYPYFAHPTFYLKRLSTLARQLSTRSGRRPLRLFFSGTVDNEYYPQQSGFDMLTRPAIIKHLTDKLEQPKYVDLRKKAKIIITNNVADNIEKHQLSSEEFLRSIALSDFFLCPPGSGMPHCHNIVEAMSVGSIPITNYHNYMSPPLTHGINCLAFDSIEDLTAIIEFLSSIQDSDIERMRGNVISYYYTFLDAKSDAAENFLAKIEEISTLVINDESMPRYLHAVECGWNEVVGDGHADRRAGTGTGQA